MKYDVIVIGAGHAGLEAAFACNKRKLKTALITLSEGNVGMMPCNPSVGGPAKGIVTREISCLGGMQALAADINQLQMKILNTSKGPGVWALRSQTDKVKYHEWFLSQVKQSDIDLIIDEATDIITQDKKVTGVQTANHGILECTYAIITTGTYLKSITFRGDDKKDEGPDGYVNAKGLSGCLKNLGFELLRLKTGTPPRILRSSIDFTDLQLEPGTDAKLCFDLFHKNYLDFDKQIPCYIIHTNETTHQIIRDNLKRSAMYGGLISGIGPRYCPSIEDKVVKFADKPRHQVFIEPESLSLPTIYLGGFSTSMPVDVQDQMIRTLPGLKNCEVKKYAYAIEYDAIDPRQLHKSLESKLITNLFFAGQINGTSGYEEAASQGLMAGINVANKHDGMEPLILKRHESYIAVMIDDITTKGVTEPYRLLTSRAEYRLNLRNDNVDERLMEISYNNKMIDKEKYDTFLRKQEAIAAILDFMKSKTVGMYRELAQTTAKTNQTLYDYLKRPEIKITDLLDYVQINAKYADLIDEELLTKVEVKVKYEGYIIKQNEELDKIRSMSHYDLTHISNYKDVPNLSLEAIDKLNKVKPDDLDQASRISGINISDIITIKVFLDKNR